MSAAKPNMLLEMIVNGHAESVSMTLALIQVLISRKILTLEDHALILESQKLIMRKIQDLNRGEERGRMIVLPPQNGAVQ